MNIKIIKTESLIEFSTCFYKLVQNLVFNNTLDLIDTKNTMEQAIEPYRKLIIACVSSLANAISLKKIINLINRQSKNFTNLQTCLVPNLAVFKKVYTVDGETSK